MAFVVLKMAKAWQKLFKRIKGI